MFFKYLGGKLIYSGCIRRNVAVEERKYISKTCEFPLLLPAATVFQLQSKQRRKLKGKKFKSKKKMWSYDERLRPPLLPTTWWFLLRSCQTNFLWKQHKYKKKGRREPAPEMEKLFSEGGFYEIMTGFFIAKTFFWCFEARSLPWMWGYKTNPLLHRKTHTAKFNSIQFSNILLKCKTMPYCPIKQVEYFFHTKNSV